MEAVIKSVEVLGKFQAKLTIGNQSFYVGDRGSKKDASYMCEMLGKALNNLTNKDE